MPPRSQLRAVPSLPPAVPIPCGLSPLLPLAVCPAPSRCPRPLRVVPAAPSRCPGRAPSAPSPLPQVCPGQPPHRSPLRPRSLPLSQRSLTRSRRRCRASWRRGRVWRAGCWAWWSAAGSTRGCRTGARGGQGERTGELCGSLRSLDGRLRTPSHPTGFPPGCSAVGQQFEGVVPRWCGWSVRRPRPMSCFALSVM